MDTTIAITSINVTDGHRSCFRAPSTPSHYTCQKIALPMIAAGSLTAATGVAAGGGSLATTTAVILTSVGAAVGGVGFVLAAVAYYRLRTASQATTSDTEAFEQSYGMPLTSTTVSAPEFLYLNFPNENSVIEWLIGLLNRYAVPPLNAESAIACALLQVANRASLINFSKTICTNPLQQRKEIEESLRQLIADCFSSDIGATQVQERRWNTLVNMLKDGLDRLSPKVPCVTSNEFLRVHQLAAEASSSLDLMSAEPVWHFPPYEQLINFIQTDHDIEVVGPRSWDKTGLLATVFFGANNENFSILRNCLTLLATSQTALTQEQLNDLLDPFVWAATAYDPNKARNVKLALMRFFADHECLSKDSLCCESHL